MYLEIPQVNGLVFRTLCDFLSARSKLNFIKIYFTSGDTFLKEYGNFHFKLATAVAIIVGAR